MTQGIIDMFSRAFKLLNSIIICLLLTACMGVPDGVKPVENFELEQYLGTWYEIARLDHSFERGLDSVTANYTVREDGGVKVINRGFDTDKDEWDEAEGKAFFVGASDVGQLKVSFFGPFYGSYNIIALDHENYQWALVVGPDTSYMWILSRDPEMDPERLQSLISMAKASGIDTNDLIMVSHDRD
jgi:apolipoprotein D and lipocalin family protein